MLINGWIEWKFELVDRRSYQKDSQQFISNAQSCSDHSIFSSIQQTQSNSHFTPIVRPIDNNTNRRTTTTSTRISDDLIHFQALCLTYSHINWSTLSRQYSRTTTITTTTIVGQLAGAPCRSLCRGCCIPMDHKMFEEENKRHATNAG